MALKNYETDYPEVRFPNGRYPIEPKETIEIDYDYEQILYRNSIILQTGGDICQVFRKKLIGTRCTNPACPAHNNWQQSGSPDCPICFGVGFVGGYDYLEEIYMRFPPTQEVLGLTPDGALRKVKPKIWTMPDPELRTFDLVINFSQPQIYEDKTEVDIEIVRGNTSFDVIDATTSTTKQIVRILKISNQPNTGADYIEGIDYELSNNGVLWITANQPELMDSYYVMYQVTTTHYRRHQITAVTPSRLRGKTLHQNIEADELEETHPLYRIHEHTLNDEEEATLYNPFPISSWFDRTI